MSVSGSPTRPITALAWTSSNSTCPADFTMIAATEDGGAANFTRGFGLKSGYHLCYSKDVSGGMVVSDVQVISERDAIPHGYCYISEFMEPKASVWKKKRVCVSLVPIASVTAAVLDIRVTTKSKNMLQHYTCLGDMLGYVLWCRKGPFSSPTPTAKPRSISIDMRSLSLEASQPLPLRQSNQPAPSAPPKMSRRRSNLDQKDSADSIYGITAMDGVPFALHPRFESQSNEKVWTSTLDNIRIKSFQDIENEYNYTFLTEEQAARRTCP
ncbi:multivesicular body subunit 12A [Trichomycterus rosablanca]|uniref:multivesicular body subunit 12A n=1 Tax=Trichomycterus rosablanca TaxID=2290929 RepID=UPI002F360A41